MKQLPQITTVPEVVSYFNRIISELKREIAKSKSIVGTQKLYGDLDLNGYRIKNLQEVPYDVRDAVTNSYSKTTPPPVHAPSHQNGGSDEINVVGLSGQLADLQKPIDHAHISSGGGVGGKLDHGSALDGLGDDDHTQYILESGARAFSGDQSHGSNKVTGVSELQLDTDCKVYMGPVIDGNYFFFLPLAGHGNSMLAEC